MHPLENLSRGTLGALSQVAATGDMEEQARHVAQALDSPPLKWTMARRAARRRGIELTDNEAFLIANELDPRRPLSEPMHRQVHQKPDGTHRITYAPGFFRLTLSLQVASVLNAIFRPKHFQSDVRGRGSRRSIGRVVDAFGSGYCWAVIADIASCYDSFSPDGCAALLEQIGLARQVTENVVFGLGAHLRPSGRRQARGNRFRRRRRSDAYALGTRSLIDATDVSSNTPHLAQRSCPAGLVQGLPASSVVCQIAFSDLAERLPSDVIVDMYCDNITVLARTRRCAEEALRDLDQYLLHHPAGQFRLGRAQIRRRDHPIDLFGYRLKYVQRETMIRPSAKNLERFRREFMLRFVNDAQAGGYDYPTAALYAQNWCRSFCLSHELSLAAIKDHWFRVADQIMNSYRSRGI